MSKTDNILIDFHNKELEKFSEILFEMGYDSILEFLECIDLDGDRGTQDLEYMKNILKPLYRDMIDKTVE